jgi:hypothetical protein
VPVANGGAGTIAIDPAGNPAVSYVDADTGEVKVARWDGTGWVSDTVSTGMLAGAMAISPGGKMAVVYTSGQGCRAPEVAISSTIGTTAAHRGLVPSFAPGWQTLALPLTAANDDETPPFPAAVAPPGSLTDAAPPALPMVLYRVLRGGNMDTGNALRAVKGTAGAGVVLSF